MDEETKTIISNEDREINDEEGASSITRTIRRIVGCPATSIVANVEQTTVFINTLLLYHLSICIIISASVITVIAAKGFGTNGLLESYCTLNPYYGFVLGFKVQLSGIRLRLRVCPNSSPGMPKRGDRVCPKPYFEQLNLNPKIETLLVSNMSSPLSL